ncbi:MAG: hypothetical protein ACOC1Q_02985 [Desulfosalsimonas sp.]
MQVSKNPWFRREEQPWYRKALMYVFVFLILPAVIFLGVVGIDVAAGEKQYREHLWLPGLLVFCAVLLFSAAILRLIRRKKADSER